MRNLLVATALVAGVALAGCGPQPPAGPDPALCQVERRTIETALVAYWATSGLEYPASLDDLIGLFLEPGAITLTWQYSSTGADYTLDGPC